MFNNLLKYLPVIVMLGLGSPGKSQVQIAFQPAIYGKTLETVMHFQVANNSMTTFPASARILVSRQPGGKMVEMKVARLLIKPGINQITSNYFSQARVAFGTSSFAGILKQTGKLPEGEYEYCYELNVLEEKPTLMQDYFENCFEYSLQPLTPLLLMDPVDKDTICNQKPSFAWQPPLPVDMTARYRLMVAEIKEKQTAAEALSFNTLVINQPDILATYLTFPPAFKELDKNKWYAWQVYYSVNGRLLLKSEIWRFRVQCEASVPDSTSDSYRALKPEIEGDYYLARRKLRFSIHNPYNAGVLNYKITPLEGTDKPVNHLPELKLVTGLNAYEINLSEYREFETDKAYKLEAVLPNGQKYYLRFTYNE